ncbi:MAG: hypothetical protein NTY13_03085 [Chlamydiae bacterium]|nr:hypothetical protein [Chlamydiota bacterium]
MFFKNSSTWLGQGLITLRGIRAPVPFYTRWIIKEKIKQEVEIKGHIEKQINIYSISEELVVTLENAEIGLWQGIGQVKGNILLWELTSEDQSLKGEEYFIQLENGRIQTNAYFRDSEGIYTFVKGEIWEVIK